MPESTDAGKTWTRLKQSYLKCQAPYWQTAESPLCKMCQEKGESVWYIVSVSKMAQQKLKWRYDNVARLLYWYLCNKHKLELAGK